MDSTARKILKLLYQHDEGLGFRDIMDQLEMSQTPLQKRLKRLIKEKYIIVSNIEEWHQGKRKIHMLTEKGQKSLEKDFGIMLQEFRNKLAEIFSKMPIKQWSEDALLKELIHDNHLRHKIKHEILTPMIFAAFIHEIHKMLLPKAIKDVDVYVGAFRKNDHVMLDLIPKQFVEELKKKETSA